MTVKKLTYRQKRIVVCNKSRIIIKACPGSGKTFSVTARLARQLKKRNLHRHQGIAVLSFTNTACNEIKKGLHEDWGINSIGYPHFIGTIDKFINDYIFLPFGHLEMNCNTRPEIVGTEYNKWFDYDSSMTNVHKDKITQRDPNYYFDKVSFKATDKNIETPFPLLPAASYHFSWINKPFKKNGKYIKRIQDIINIKKEHFKNGKANQADANYFADLILSKYPSILKNLIHRFPILIVDEAQDTTEVQMAIIDKLAKANIPSIMLIGDPYQAIFEWNSANPELFLQKWEDKINWTQLDLDENMRCSTHICNYLNKFFDDQNNMKSIAKDKNCTETPQIVGYSDDRKESVQSICKNFMDKCNGLKIEDNNLSIVYRGQSFGEEYFNKLNHNKEESDLPWAKDNYFVRDIVQGKYFMEIGNFSTGLKLIEKGYHKYKLKQRYVPQGIINQIKKELGFREYRKEIFDFIKTLPLTENKKLIEWINEVKQHNPHEFNVKTRKANIGIIDIFHENTKEKEDSYLKTIHSVKGENLDAILVFFKKQDHSNYSNVLKKKYNSLSNADKEQLRIVYVACSRPRKILWIAVPKDDISVWENYFEKRFEKRENPIQLTLNFFS